MFPHHFTLGQCIFVFHFQLWVRTQIGSEIYWFGLNDIVVEGVWEWSDGSPFIEYLSYVILLIVRCHKSMKCIKA